MRLVSFIIVTLFLALWAVQTATAQSLTPAEKRVCQSLRQCLGIVERHNATEFDYAVLTEEFRRFGEKGRASLFRILDREEGHADIAKIISALGPLSERERQLRDAAWGGPQTQSWLPLADETTDWITLLDHPDRVLRELANTELFFQSQNSGNYRPVVRDYEPLLSFMKQRPLAHLAGLLRDINVERYHDELTDLLLSGEARTVTTIYAILARNDAEKALSNLRDKMKIVETPEQARGLGGMMASRIGSKNDPALKELIEGILRDQSQPMATRAIALDAYLKIAAEHEAIKLQHSFPAEQGDALSFLLGTSNWDAVAYAKALAPVSKNDTMTVWTHLHSHVVPHAEAALPVLRGTAFEAEILKREILSRDGRVRDAAYRRAKALGLPLPSKTTISCEFDSYDTADLTQQMPFFETGFIPGAWPQTLIRAHRGALKTAHPTKTGWLAGYDIGEHGGGLVHFDNQTGESRDIRFNPYEADMDQWAPENVIAILPDRKLALGETAQYFWVVTELNHFGTSGHTIHIVAEDVKGFAVKPVARDLGSTDRIALSADGDLLLADEAGRTTRLSANGTVLYGCEAID